MKKKFGNESNDDKNLDEIDLKEDIDEKKKSILKEDEKNNKKKQSKIIQQKIKNKKIISHSICKLNIYFIAIFAIIFLISFSFIME